MACGRMRLSSPDAVTPRGVPPQFPGVSGRTALGSDALRLRSAATSSNARSFLSSSYAATLSIEGAPRREVGQSTVEYGLIIGAIAVVLIVGMLFLAGKVEDLFTGGSDSPIFRPPVAACDANYSGACIPPPPPGLDCDDLQRMGIGAEVRVVGEDPHDLDGDGDGIACN